MDEKERKISVWVSPWMFREFFRLFPEHGGRSKFLREAIAEAIKMGPEKSLAKRIMEKYEDD